MIHQICALEFKNCVLVWQLRQSEGGISYQSMMINSTEISVLHTIYLMGGKKIKQNFFNFCTLHLLSLVGTTWAAPPTQTKPKVLAIAKAWPEPNQWQNWCFEPTRTENEKIFNALTRNNPKFRLKHRFEPIFGLVIHTLLLCNLEHWYLKILVHKGKVTSLDSTKTSKKGCSRVSW